VLVVPLGILCIAGIGVVVHVVAAMVAAVVHGMVVAVVRVLGVGRIYIVDTLSLLRLRGNMCCYF
jgi:hypothetical protein